MADDTQGKAQQRPAAGGPSNPGAIDKGEAAAARRPAPRPAAPTAAPAPENSVLNPGGKDDDRPTAEDIVKRAPKTYRAMERGYIDGRIVEAGEVFATTADQGAWMEPVKKSDQAYGVDKATEEAGYARKADVDLEGLSHAALEVLAAMAGVSKPGELNDEELITAIRAARRVDAQ